jgi:hypothetical protein
MNEKHEELKVGHDDLKVDHDGLKTRVENMPDA